MPPLVNRHTPSIGSHLPAARSRRDFLRRAGGGFGMLALLDLLARDGLLTEVHAAHDARQSNPLAPRPPQFPAAAKSVISLFMYGGPSQMDLFDPKPELQRRDGQPLPTREKLDVFFGSPGPLMASPFTFAQHAQSGQWVSELLPRVATVIDEIAVIKSMYAESNNHAPALFQMNTGLVRPGSPSLGSWVTYGLGTENQDLPAFVVMCDTRGGPIGGAPNWGSGYMSAAFQGTPFRTEGAPILDLAPPPGFDLARQRANLDLLDTLNRGHLADHPGETELQARIQSYELAFRMQAEAPRAVDLAGESAATKRLYGFDDPVTEPFGRRLLIARRLVERGVRFVQVYNGGGNFDENWDAHYGLEKNHRLHCAETDLPIAGLITDLKARGLLDETLVLWGGEFGRMPVSQSKIGRDHNPHGFTCWMAGGGVKGGVSYGETDEFGYKAVEDRCHVNDWHATILHLLGLDHTQLTFLHDGRQKRLTDVGGRVLTAILRQKSSAG
jgi:Protein of unknown function (DUF1501)